MDGYSVIQEKTHKKIMGIGVAVHENQRIGGQLLQGKGMVCQLLETGAANQNLLVLHKRELL